MLELTDTTTPGFSATAKSELEVRKGSNNWLFLARYWIWFIIMMWQDTQLSTLQMFVKFLGMSLLPYMKCSLCTEAHVEIVCVSPEGSSRSLLSCKDHRQGAKLISWVLGQRTLEFLTLLHVWLLVYPFIANILAQVMLHCVRNIISHVLWHYRLLWQQIYSSSPIHTCFLIPACSLEGAIIPSWRGRTVSHLSSHVIICWVI